MSAFPTVSGIVGAVALTLVVACSDGMLELPTCSYQARIATRPFALEVGTSFAIRGGLAHYGKCKQPANPPARLEWTSTAPEVANITQATDSSATVIAIRAGTTLVRLTSPETGTSDTVSVSVIVPL